MGAGRDLHGHSFPHSHGTGPGGDPSHGPGPGGGHSHGPGRGEDHTHGTGPGPEENLGPSAEASVVLDIGPHAGALVVYTDEDLAGAEIEIRPGGEAWTGTHTAVRERHAGGRVLHAGVFGSLVEGRYDLRLKGGGPGSFGLTVEVVAGAVTEAEVPSPVRLSGTPAR